MRLNADGTLDNTYNYANGSYGAGMQDQYGNPQQVQVLAMQPDGKMLAGGYFTQFNDASAPSGVARFKTDGQLDNTFNYSGAATAQE